MWDAQVEFFAPNYRVVRFDTRGFGRTRTEDIEFSNRADAAAVLEHFGVEQAVVIGCSRGGQIAIDFALELPQRVLALAPVASGPSGYPFEPPDTELSRLVAQSFEAMEAAETARDFVKLTDLEVRLWGDGPNQPEGRMAAPVREKMRAMIRNTYSTRTTEGKPIALNPPAYGRLSEISVPTLIVEGDLDLPSIAEMADAMQRLIPHARRLTMHGTAHLPSMEQPDAFNRALQDFLAQHGL
jgi:pimeloyl-ACP methyl ester carboxylesterase